MTNDDESVQWVVREGIAHVRLNRPDKRNAFDDQIAAKLDSAFEELGKTEDVRVIVFGGSGASFCAGGDLEWMRRVADYSREENLADAEAFQRAFERIDRCPVPVVGRIHGHAFGGGAGLVALCDIAVAESDTKFAFSEVRLGLVPGVISPYVLRKVGFSHTRQLFLTGERFGATKAREIGLVHHVVPMSQMDAAVDLVVQRLMECAPGGVRGAKALLHEIREADHETALRLAREAIADARASDDGREGTSAFLENRPPRWAQ